MTRLVLNDAQQSVENVPVYWGELLKGLDEHANERGEVVTAVRFDGVDEPTFRQPALVGRPLREVRTIELETATSSDLLDDALVQGAAAARTLAALAREIGSAFRGTDRSQAN